MQDDSCEVDPPHACAWRMASLIFAEDHALVTRAVGGVTLGLGVSMYRGLVAELKASGVPNGPCLDDCQLHALQRTCFLR
jgi:hypothetical protein